MRAGLLAARASDFRAAPLTLASLFLLSPSASLLPQAQNTTGDWANAYKSPSQRPIVRRTWPTPVPIATDPFVVPSAYGASLMASFWVTSIYPEMDDFGLWPTRLHTHDARPTGGPYHQVRMRTRG